jgi:hypothetical protein
VAAAGITECVPGGDKTRQVRPASGGSTSPTRTPPAEDGELAFTGGPARGHSADEIVTSLQQANAPDAVPDYVVPGASLGYGEAFQVTPSSADGNPVRFEVTIIGAIRDG